VRRGHDAEQVPAGLQRRIAADLRLSTGVHAEVTGAAEAQATARGELLRVSLLACVGVAALLMFWVWLGWLPAIGGLLAPVIILGIDNAGQLAKPLSEEVAEVAALPHVMAARARGLSPLWLARWHILPLAAPVAVSLSGVMLAGLLGGTLTMELLFGLPGLGALVLNGIQGRDQPVVLAGLVVAALAIVLVNALTSLALAALDPRQRWRE
jgi:peptide/nickel transport system permease protein